MKYDCVITQLIVRSQPKIKMKFKSKYISPAVSISTETPTGKLNQVNVRRREEMIIWLNSLIWISTQ